MSNTPACWLEVIELDEISMAYRTITAKHEGPWKHWPGVAGEVPRGILDIDTERSRRIPVRMPTPLIRDGAGNRAPLHDAIVAFGQGLGDDDNPVIAYVTEFDNDCAGAMGVLMHCGRCGGWGQVDHGPDTEPEHCTHCDGDGVVHRAYGQPASSHAAERMIRQCNLAGFLDDHHARLAIGAVRRPTDDVYDPDYRVGVLDQAADLADRSAVEDLRRLIEAVAASWSEHDSTEARELVDELLDGYGWREE